MKVPVVISITPDYIIPAMVLILSMLASSEDCQYFEVIILSPEVLAHDAQTAFERVGGKRVSFKFIVPGDILGTITINPRFSMAAYYRLMAAELLPDYQTIIYMDSDMVVRQNVWKLYQSTDVSGYYLSAVIEATLPFQEKYLNAHNLSAGKYFNSGFLIMNLDALRAANMGQKFIKLGETIESSFPDQDVLNILCGTSVLPLSPVFNAQRTMFLPQFRRIFLMYYSSDEWRTVQRSGNIHYTGPKPWQLITVKFYEWWEYYFKIPAEVRELVPLNTPGNIMVWARLSILKTPMRLLRNLLGLIKTLTRNAGR